MSEPVEMVILSSTESLGAQVRAETDVAINTAHLYPRNIKQSKEDILAIATQDLDTASGCFYSLPRGGKVITGPSVRLAEIILYSWGNLKASTRLIANDGRTLTVEAVVIDLEKNTTVQLPVTRKTTDKYGKPFTEDMRIMAQNAASAIALRNCVFKIVPGIIMKPILDAVQTLAKGDPKDLKVRRVKWMEYFRDTWKVSQERVLKAIGRETIEDVVLDDLVTLNGIKTALEEGSTIDDAFPIEITKQESKQEAANEALSKVSDELAEKHRKNEEKKLKNLKHGEYAYEALTEGMIKDSEGSEAPVLIGDTLTPSTVEGLFLYGDLSITEKVIIESNLFGRVRV